MPDCPTCGHNTSAFCGSCTAIVANEDLTEFGYCGHDCSWVSLPFATFAVIVDGGTVVETAPYGRKIVPIGMDERAAAEKLRRLGARLIPLPSDQRDVISGMMQETDVRSSREGAYLRGR